MSGDHRSSSASDRPVPSSPLRAGLALSGLTVTQLWVRYVGLGGSMPEVQLLSALRGGELAPHEHDVVAHALNEYFTEQGGDHPVAYTNEINDNADERRS